MIRSDVGTKKLLVIPILLFWCLSAFAGQPVRETRFAKAGEYFQWEWRFCAGVADICFGNGTCPNDYGVSTGYLDGMRFQCITGGQSTKIRILTPADGTNTGYIRMGVYAEDGQLPGALLWEGTNQPYVAGAWIEEVVTSLTLESEVYYWLAYKVSQSTAEICYVPFTPAPRGPTHIWKRFVGFGNAFPDPWGSLDGGNFDRYSMQLCIAGGVADVYSGKFPRGIFRGIGR